MSAARLPVDRGPAAFLDAYAAAVRPQTIRHGEAYWAFSCHGTPEAQDVVAEVEEWLSDLHADERAHDAIARWRRDGVADPLVARQLDVLWPDYRRAQADEALRKKVIRLSLKVEETCSVFRPELNGERISSNELDRLLVHSTDDGERRAAWTATREVGAKVADRVVELAKLRNAQARQLGFADWFALALDDEEMDAGFLDGLLGELRDGSAGPWAEVKASLDAARAEQRGKAPSDLMPWDYGDRFLQSIPRSGRSLSLDAWFQPTRIKNLAKTWFRSLGLPIDALWDRSDMMPRDGKYPHAFCIGVDNPGDVRVLCNLDATARWMETVLHEFGHALYNAWIDPELPFVLRESAHTFVTEAVAMLFGRLAKTPWWLADHAGVPADRAEAAGRRLREDQLTFARWGLVVTLFEQAMYADPEADLTAIWWDLVGELQGLRRPAGWDGYDWASKVHVACYPAYYQYYLLGELLASQLRAAMAEADDGGAFLVELFRSGRSRRWDDVVRSSCGEELSAAAWLQEFTA